MRSALLTVLGLTLLVGMAGGSVLQAEDWTTAEGIVYQHVKLIKTEPDAVTILYRDGGALVPLSKLPPELQKRFHYDPDVAKVAADVRAEVDVASQRALWLERREMQIKKEAYLSALSPVPFNSNPTSGLNIVSSPFTADPSDVNHHAVADLGNIHQRLSNADFDSSHLSKGTLVSASHELSAPPDPNHHTIGELGVGF